MKANPITNLLGPMDGAEIPGGCESCEAVQRFRMESALLFVLEVVHDDDCPSLKRGTGR
ncbi:MAG: hypothetical protein JWM85_2230 [Acidimicrobiaceae bacterium]|nr:hypothetical protein [Acidimicrobiaceae bacterium]